MRCALECSDPDQMQAGWHLSLRLHLQCVALEAMMTWWMARDPSAVGSPVSKSLLDGPS